MLYDIYKVNFTHAKGLKSSYYFATSYKNIIVRGNELEYKKIGYAGDSLQLFPGVLWTPYVAAFTNTETAKSSLLNDIETKAKVTEKVFK